MLVIGYAVMCLDGKGDMTVLDSEEEDSSNDVERVKAWVGADGFRLREGLGEGWRRITQGE